MSPKNPKKRLGENHERKRYCGFCRSRLRLWGDPPKWAQCTYCGLEGRPFYVERNRLKTLKTPNEGPVL